MLSLLPEGIEMVDWTEVITTIASILITGGGITIIATIKDKKYEAVQNNILKLIENVSKTNEAWEKIADWKFKDIEEEKKENLEKDAKIDKLYGTISTLRTEVDHLRTENAVLQIIKCKIIECGKREPPLTKILPNYVDQNRNRDENKQQGNSADKEL